MERNAGKEVARKAWRRAAFDLRRDRKLQKHTYVQPMSPPSDGAAVDLWFNPLEEGVELKPLSG